MTIDGKPQRFVGSTDSINIKMLERETQKLLYLGFVIAICFHVATAILFSFKKTEEKVLKPLMVDLIITRPRLKKPFIIRKKMVRKKPIYKKEFDFRKSLHELEIPSLLPFDVHDREDSLLIGDYTVFYDIVKSLRYEDSAQELDKLRDTPHDISFEREILSVGDLDYGKYKGLVILDPLNKRKIEGFVYIPVTVRGAMLKPLDRPVIGLSEGLKRYTNITPNIEKYVKLSSPKIFKFPFIYIATVDAFELTPAEKRVFMEYLSNGGFAVLDNCFPQDRLSSSGASLRKMLWDVITTIGGNSFIANIPFGHPLYHCFFDFHGGPPGGAELSPLGVFAAGKKVLNPVYHFIPHLEGLWVNNRLTAVYCNKGYGIKWSQISDNNSELRMGVNMVVYALIRNNTIAQRYIKERYD